MPMTEAQPATFSKLRGEFAGQLGWSPHILPGQGNEFEIEPAAGVASVDVGRRPTREGSS